MEKSNYRLLTEDDVIQWLKRRVTYNNMNELMYKAESEFENPCDDFSDEFDFADGVISYAIDDILSLNEDIINHDRYDEFRDTIYELCKEWFGERLMGIYYDTCQEDEELMSEQVDVGVNTVVNKLFKILNEEKKKVKTRKELLEAIKKYTPYLNIPKGYEIYLLELYLLNYRKDGDYSELTKDNFVDPRNMKGKWTPNTKADQYTRAQLPFKGSNLEGYWTSGGKGTRYYVVQSYGWYPVYIYRDGIWYESIDRYSSSTSKQMYNVQPYDYSNTLESKVYLLTRDEMTMVEGGIPHDEIMREKRKKLKKSEPELKAKKLKTYRSWGGWGNNPNNLNIKFKINSVEDEGDKSIVNVDIYDVLRRENGKSVPTPENYLKGELPNVDKEKVENELKNRLKTDFRQYLGPRFDKMEDQNVEFRFNHLKK